MLADGTFPSKMVNQRRDGESGVGRQLLQSLLTYQSTKAEKFIDDLLVSGFWPPSIRSALS
jgi:hypothetical protein